MTSPRHSGPNVLGSSHKNAVQEPFGRRCVIVRHAASSTPGTKLKCTRGEKLIGLKLKVPWRTPQLLGSKLGARLNDLAILVRYAKRGVIFVASVRDHKGVLGVPYAPGVSSRAQYPMFQ